MRRAKLAITLATLVVPGLAAATVFPVHVLTVSDDVAVLKVEVPRGHAVYADHLGVFAADGQPLALELPPADRTPPELAPQAVYTRDFTLWVPVPPDASAPLRLDIRGCDYRKGVCFEERGTAVMLP